MADDKDTVAEGGAAGCEQTGEESQGATITDVHRNPDDENYPLDIAGEEEVTTQGKEDMEDYEEDDENDDEEEDEELEVMIKISNVQAGRSTGGQCPLRWVTKQLFFHFRQQLMWTYSGKYTGEEDLRNHQLCQAS